MRTGCGGAARRYSTGRRPGLQASGPAPGGSGRSERRSPPSAACRTGTPAGRRRRSCIPAPGRRRCRRPRASCSSSRRHQGCRRGLAPLIEAVLPQIPHGRCPRSWRRHRWQIGCPSPVRPATGLIAWQRAHSAAAARCAHGGHVPPWLVRVSGRPVRPQITQAGTLSTDQRAISSLTRRPTNGGAPAASAPGSLATAVARLRSAAGPAAAASTAAAITSRGSDPSTAATRVTTVSRRHDGQNGRRALASSWPAEQHATATCGPRPPEPAPGGVAVLAAVPAAGPGAGPSPVR